MPDASLEGVTILDLTHGVTGPYATKLFPDDGAEGLAADPRFAGTAARYRNQGELDPIIAGWSRTQDRDGMMKRLQVDGKPSPAGPTGEGGRPDAGNRRPGRMGAVNETR